MASKVGLSISTADVFEKLDEAFCQQWEKTGKPVTFVITDHEKVTEKEIQILVTLMKKNNKIVTYSVPLLSNGQKARGIFILKIRLKVPPPPPQVYNIGKGKNTRSVFVSFHSKDD
jgi:DNA-binding MltR family transcriptional regulator